MQITVPNISVIICSCNRAAELEATLLAFRDVNVPSGWKCEIILVDNASNDETTEKARQVHLSHIETRFLFEPRKGKGNALNTGLANARYDIVLFTDDDVRPAADWLEQLAGPLCRGECDAVVGKIVLAPHLNRPWLTQNYKSWLAREAPPTEWPLELIGANMGFRRSVLEKVPAFDSDLAPGGLGLGEDALFSWQLREAGFTIQFVEQAIVVHSLSASRLRRSAWLKAAEAHGRTNAYLCYHWKHEDVVAPGVRLLLLRLKLFLRRILQPVPSSETEGCPPWEMGYVGGIARYSQYIKERKRPRNYSKRGLAKLNL
jgi:glucosyl-dolichyl phosphate glucuronosyltransferase